MSAVWGWLAGIAVGLLVNEVGEVSPWLARKITAWAAKVRYPGREQELLDTIEDVPGKLFKLITACGYGVRAVSRLITKRARGIPAGFGRRSGVALTAGLAFTAMLLVTGVFVKGVPNGGMLSLGAGVAVAALLELVGGRRCRSGTTTGGAVMAAMSGVLIVNGLPTNGLFLSAVVAVLGIPAGLATTATTAVGRVLSPWPAAAIAIGTGATQLAVGAAWTTSTNPHVGFASTEAKVLFFMVHFGVAIGLSVGAAVVLWGRRVPLPAPARS